MLTIGPMVTEVTAAQAEPAASPARTTGEFGVMLFLASDVMLFSAFFAAYFLLRSTAAEWPIADAPPEIVRAGVFTAVLVASSFTMIASDRARDDGHRAGARRWLIATIALGAAFLANQLVEYATLPFAARDSTYGSIYWGLTGLHAAHVTAGVCALGLLLVRLTRARDLADTSSWAAGISLYWHLVDIVWIGVFLTIWVIR